MMQNTKKEIHKWLVKTVIGLNLCPFAKDPHEKGQIHIDVSKASSFESAYQDFVSSLNYLNEENPIKTTLLVFDQLDTSFEDFNDFVGSVEDNLDENGLLNIFQLVCFHPEFRFADSDTHDLANLVNRSPKPLIHILFTEDITVATKDLAAGENISFTNEKNIKNLSESELKEFFWYLY
jgi:hypothetical protein